ncbi:MAG: winged helix-turn-helix transcriptional regulator [Moraxellaceae bacterium]|nr:winged helix-turn-helix transcriptional regulator [Moraxellaceae bacterium]
MNYRQYMQMITGYNLKLTQLYYDYAKQNGIRYNTLAVLYVVHLANSCTQKLICQQTGLPKQTVNAVIKDFLYQQYVEFAQGANKKEKLVQFTDSGQQYAEQLLMPIFAIEEKVLKRMGEKKCQQIIDEMEEFTFFFEKELINLQKFNKIN